jgi:hypothetical protein
MVHANLSATHLQLGRRQEALEHARLAVEGAPRGFHKASTRRGAARRARASAPGLRGAAGAPPLVPRAAIRVPGSIAPRARLRHGPAAMRSAQRAGRRPSTRRPPQAHVRLIDSLYALGRLAEAADALDAAVARDPSFTSTPEHRVRRVARGAAAGGALTSFGGQAVGRAAAPRPKGRGLAPWLALAPSRLPLNPTPRNSAPSSAGDHASPEGRPQGRGGLKKAQPSPLCPGRACAYPSQTRCCRLRAIPTRPPGAECYLHTRRALPNFVLLVACMPAFSGPRRQPSQVARS